MIEEFKNHGWKDFQQRYTGTFGWFKKEDGSQVLVNVGVCDGTTLVFNDASKMPYYAKADSGNEFTFIPTVKGAYQYKDTVLVVLRIPARQYKRGICRENTQLYDLVRRTNLTPGFETLAAIFGPKDNSVLLQWCKDRNGVVCLDGVFSIVNDVVYIYNEPIGAYIMGKKMVTLHNDIFRQELVDVFTRLKVDVGVAVE